MEQDILIQIVLVRRVPSVDAADPENPVAILIHQFQELLLVCRSRIQSWAFID
jgi:hypothetical protein